jgi:hypothetical protein
LGRRSNGATSGPRRAVGLSGMHDRFVDDVRLGQMRSIANWGGLLALFAGAVLAFPAAAAPTLQQLASDLYAYISDNDGSANSTFLIGSSSILVVDAGLNRTEAEKILREILKISPLPIAYIVNTH